MSVTYASAGSRPVESVDALDPAGRPPSARQGWIDAAKGIGILLVVYGHAVDGLTGAGLLGPDGALNASFYVIYTFHMPLFFLLSGLLVARRVARDRSRFVRRLLPTIAWPYFLWSAIQVTVIALAADYVNTPGTGIGGHLYALLLWDPPSQFWFLYVLFFLHLAAALLIRRGIPLLVPVALAAILYPVPELTGNRDRLLEMFGHFAIFYALGVVAGRHLDRLKAWLCDDAVVKATIGAVLFAASAAAGLAYDVPYWAAIHLPTALAGTAVTLMLATRVGGGAARVLEYLGQRAMAIYVLHVLFVAGCRIVITRLTGFEDGALLVLLLTLIGIVAPLIVLTVAERLRLAAALGLGAPPRMRPALG